jgi:ribosome-binding ATPase YchF (GTP1/OBG family)
MIDVAGLVPGAHEGKGLGNKFLDDLRQADVLIHVVDISGSMNEKGEAVAMGSHDPIQDVKFLEEELDLWMLGILQNNWNKFVRTPITGKQQLIDSLAQNLSGLGVKPEQLDKALMRTKLAEKKLVDWTPEEQRVFITDLRKLSKPIVIAANKMDLPPSVENLKRVREAFPHLSVFACSGEAELTLKKAAKAGIIDYTPGDANFTLKKELSEAQKQGLEYIRKNVLEKLGGTGVQETLDRTVLNALGYKAIFPGGTKGLTDSQGRTLPDCFLMPASSTTLDFAFKLHTDFGKNFIKAIDVKTKMLLGKDHVLKHRDVIEIVANK